jgi:Phage major capsid protein E
MGSATGRDLHIDQVLSQMAMGYRPSGFIADMIFPTVSVQKQSDLYLVFDRGDRMRVEDTTRAPGTRARRVTEAVGSNTYFARNFALASPAVLEDKVNADPAHVASVINGKTTFLMDKLLLDWERRIALKVTSGSNVGSSAAVSSGWEGSGSDPIGNLNTAIDNVADSNGVRPNRIVMGLEAWRSFRRHADVRGLIFGTNNGGGYPSLQQAANLLDVEQILVGGAYHNSAQEGQSESLASIWTDQVLVYYAPSAPSKETPSFGYNFRWAAAGLPNMQVERHPYDSNTKSEDIEVGYYQDEKVTGASYAFLLKSVNSST